MHYGAELSKSAKTQMLRQNEEAAAVKCGSFDLHVKKRSCLCVIIRPTEYIPQAQQEPFQVCARTNAQRWGLDEKRERQNSPSPFLKMISLFWKSSSDIISGFSQLSHNGRLADDIIRHSSRLKQKQGYTYKKKDSKSEMSASVLLLIISPQLTHMELI